MPRKPLDQCGGCGVTVVWAITSFGTFMAFDRPDTHSIADARAQRWALTPATEGHHPTVRDMNNSTLPRGYNERPALPHSHTCTRSRVRPRRRRSASLTR